MMDRQDRLRVEGWMGQIFREMVYWDDGKAGYEGGGG